MKQYNLIENRREMEFPFGKMNVLFLGEEGRGRRYQIIPFASTIMEGDEVTIGKSKADNPKIIPATTSSPEWLAYISAQGTYTRNTLGACYVLQKQVNNVNIIARGNGAYGMAGRIGDWYDYLLIIQPHTWVLVRPSGGTHKMERYFLYFGNEQVFTFTAEAAKMFVDTENCGGVIPNDFNINEYRFKFDEWKML